MIRAWRGVNGKRRHPSPASSRWQLTMSSEGETGLWRPKALAPSICRLNLQRQQKVFYFKKLRGKRVTIWVSIKREASTLRRRWGEVFTSRRKPKKHRPKAVLGLAKTATKVNATPNRCLAAPASRAGLRWPVQYTILLPTGAFGHQTHPLSPERLQKDRHDRHHRHTLKISLVL